MEWYIKRTWEKFFTPNTKATFSSASINKAKTTSDDPSSIAETLVDHLLNTFASQGALGHFDRYMILSQWADRSVREELIKESIALIEKTRKDNHDENSN